MILIVTVALAPAAFAKKSSTRKAPEINITKWMTDAPPDVNSLDGRVYVVDFWATWCHSCVRGIKDLNEINKKYKDQGLVFLSLCQDRSEKKINKLIHEKNINFHLAIDNGTADWYQVRYYPTVAVVNHKGNIIFQGKPWDKKFENSIKKALDDRPEPLFADLDLGPFSHFKDDLYGGKSFLSAYTDLRTIVARNDPNSPAAINILRSINDRLSQRLQKARQLQKDNPENATKIYADLFSRYDGIEILNHAKEAYQKLLEQLGKEINPALR